MTTTERDRCRRCEAELRRIRRRSGPGLCDPCRRVGPDPRRDLPPGFYFQDRIAAALAEYDFRIVFRRVRAHTGWSQQTLANLVGLDQSRISAIERGVNQLRDVALVAQVATALCIPPVLLGFGTTVGDAGGGDGRKVVSWVDRRDFVHRVATLTVAATGVAGLDIERLTALLPHADPTGTRHIGAADVETIEQATAAFRRQDFTHGSGMARDTAVVQLQSVLPLLDAQATSEVRSRLLVATADLALQAGYMSLEVKQQEAARRLWMIGLDIARTAEDPQSSDLTVYLLYDMALQAVELGRPDEALRLVHLGHATAAGPHPISASTTGCLASIQARAHAAQRNATGCDRALGQAIEQFSSIDPATTPPWSAHVGETGGFGYRGAAHYTLALPGRDPGAANRAVSLLRHGVNGFGSGYARLQALYLPDLAGAHAIAGDIDTAVTVGHRAIDAVTAMHSPRAYDRLRFLNTALEPLRTSTGVAELRDRLAATAT